MDLERLTIGSAILSVPDWHTFPLFKSLPEESLKGMKKLCILLPFCIKVKFVSDFYNTDFKMTAVSSFSKLEVVC